MILCQQLYTLFIAKGKESHWLVQVGFDFFVVLGICMIKPAVICFKMLNNYLCFYNVWFINKITDH